MRDSHNPPAVMVHSVSEIETYAAWILGMVVAVAVFFQVHVSLSGGLINLNLADPFAILALAAVSLHMLFVRQSPVWRIRQFNLVLGMISLLLLLGFVQGWWKIGITQWALGGRLLGWLVLLGYLSAGYLVVANVGTHGLRRFAETLIATAVVVVMMQVVVRLLYYLGIDTGAQLAPRFEGYAGNRNAFAFQLLTVMTLLLGYSHVYARHIIGIQRPARRWVFSLLLAILLAGLVWTGSRAGMLVGVMVLLLAWFGRLADRRILGWGLIFAALLWFGVWLVTFKELVQGILSVSNFFRGVLTGTVQDGFPGTVLDGFPGTVPNSFPGTVPDSSRDASNHERWQTMVHGLELWLQSPVLGVGLGVFHAKSPMWLGHPQVIHNTPLWILAEFGLVGTAVFGWTFFLLLQYAIPFGRTQPARRILLLLSVAFAIFSLVHEILYQRIFWLVLGAVLAQPFASRIRP
jgi:hypothetical protein